MSEATANVAAYVAAQREQAPALPAFGTPSLDASRAQALESLSQFGLPSQRDEDWKYTSTRASLLAKRQSMVSMPGGWYLLMGFGSQNCRCSMICPRVYRYQALASRWGASHSV